MDGVSALPREVTFGLRRSRTFYIKFRQNYRPQLCCGVRILL